MGPLRGPDPFFHLDPPTLGSDKVDTSPPNLEMSGVRVWCDWTHGRHYFWYAGVHRISHHRRISGHKEQTTSEQGCDDRKSWMSMSECWEKIESHWWCNRRLMKFSSSPVQFRSDMYHNYFFENQTNHCFVWMFPMWQHDVATGLHLLCC